MEEISKSIVEQYEDYYENIAPFESAIRDMEHLAWEQRLSEEEISDFSASNLGVPAAEIFYIRAILHKACGHHHDAIRLARMAIEGHPLPLRSALLLSELYYFVGEYQYAIIYADIVEEMERVRDEIAFVDQARSIKVMAFYKLHDLKSAILILANCANSVEFHADGEYFSYEAMKALLQKR